MTILIKILGVLLLLAIVIAIPTLFCYAIYVMLLKLGAAKWAAAAIAIACWVVMGISYNNKK